MADEKYLSVRFHNSIFMNLKLLKCIPKNMKRIKDFLFNCLRFFIILILLLILAQKTFGQVASSDYTSKVPKYTFAITLPEQEAQLKTNPLMLRLIESRKKMANDPYRPIYHFVSPEGNLNDPNGLCYWKGNWHLFYQGYPPEDTRQHWGHAISKDLIHWKDLPYAIYPGPERAVFSGATYVDGNRAVSYTHLRAHETRHDFVCRLLLEKKKK